MDYSGQILALSDRGLVPIQSHMGFGWLDIRSTYLWTYFLGGFGLRVCKDTLLEMGCVSSFADFNLVISTLSWGFLTLLRNSNHPPVAPPVLPRTRIVTALLQIVHFMTRSKSIAVNSYSAHRFALLLSIPYCLIYGCVIQSRRYPLLTLLGLATFCLGSVFVWTDSFSLSTPGILIGLACAVMNAHLSLFIEAGLLDSNPILFQDAVAGFRVVFSVIISASCIAIRPTDTFSVQMEPYPLCLLVAAAGLELAVSVSMTSLIAASSALSFLVVEQLCELVVILIGHTLNPTRFATFREEILSFLGFALAIPGQILFVVNDDAPPRMPDVEPFQIGPEAKETDLDDEG
jgi:hypothetical protein